MGGTRALALLIASITLAAADVAALDADDAGVGGSQAAPVAWHAREAAGFLDAHERTREQLANPEFTARRVSSCQVAFSPPGCGDPFRDVGDWNGTRGHAHDVTWLNRYNATIAGTLWWPLGEPPFPAVIMVGGYGAQLAPYRWAAQGLSEEGYLVLQFSPQGTGASSPDPSPQEFYCDGDGTRWWEQPQEMGVVEHGACAGQASREGTLLLAQGLAALAATDDATELEPFHEADVAPYALGALDATKWLLATPPWRDLVDTDRIGIVGHSLGGYGALLAGNGDPLERFRAVVAWDALARLPERVLPRVPTMLQQSEVLNFVGPRRADPPEDGPTPLRDTYHRLREVGAPAAFVVLRSSTHWEWHYEGPELAALSAASAKGERVAFYYTLAWLDRYLKDDHSAAARLHAARFDSSADRSAIGAGIWDPSLAANVPHYLARERVADHLSFHFRTQIASTSSPASALRP